MSRTNRVVRPRPTCEWSLYLADLRLSDTRRGHVERQPPVAERRTRDIG